MRATAEARIINLPQQPPVRAKIRRKLVTLPRPPRKRTGGVPSQLKGPLGDMENFSFARWLLAKKEEHLTGKAARYSAPYEAKYYANKAQRETIGQDGGFLAPEEWRTEFFRVLRGGLILNKLETNIYTTKYRVARITKGVVDWTWTYTGENVAPVSTDRAFMQNTFNFRKGVAFATTSNDLIKDSADLADVWLREDAASSAAHEIDKQILFGDGLGGRPLGLVNESFINNLTPFNDSGNGATPIYNDITNLIQQVAILGNTSFISGGAAECNGMVAHPRFGTTLDNIQSPAGIPIWQNGLSNDVDMPDQPRWLGVKNWVLSALVPANVVKGSSSDCSFIIAGDWRYYVLIMREDFQFTMSDRPAAANDQSMVKVIARYDGQPIWPFAFAVATGIRG